MKKILFIDGNSILSRAYYGLRTKLTDSKGRPTNALVGFLNILKKVYKDEKPQKIVVCFDVKGGSHKRKELSQEYKALRKAQDEEYLIQLDLIKVILQEISIDVVTKQGFEADDLIGTLSSRASKEGYTCVILSGDKDLIQLVDDNTYMLYDYKGIKNILNLDKDRTFDYLGIRADQVVDFKALAGDGSDNYPGVSGIGEQTAKRLLNYFGTLDEIYQNVDKIDDLRKEIGTTKKLTNLLKENKDQAYVCQELARIIRDVNLDISISDLKDPFKNSNISSLEDLGLRNMIEFLEENNFIEEKDEVISELEFITSEDELSRDKYVIYDRYQHKDLKLHAYLQNGKCLITDHYIEGLKIVGYETKELYVDYLKGLIKRPDIVDDIALLDFLINNEVTTGFNYIDQNLKEYRLKLKNIKKDLSNAREIIEDLLAKSLIKLNTIYLDLKKKLKENKNIENLYIKIEFPLIEVLSKMEYEGFKVDLEEARKIQKHLDEKIENTKREIFELAQEEFNLNSPTQVSDILFEKLRIPKIKKVKEGSKHSTDRKVLDKLIDVHPIIPLIIDYRTYTKIKFTYVDSIFDLVDNQNKVHTKLRQMIALTGRLSSQDPNLQNIPIRLEEGRAIRKIYVASSDENILLSADYSQIELRLLAHIAGEENMIKGFNEGIDIHALTASKVFHVDVDEVTSEQRSRAKAVNFGIIYGMSDFGLSQNLDIPIFGSHRYKSQYFKQYPKIEKYFDDIIDFCKRHKYVETIYGRRRFFPNIDTSNKIQYNEVVRAALNAPIQGSAADIIKIAMVLIDEKLSKSNIRAKMILQVHDELIFDVHKEDVGKLKELLIKEMVESFSLSVPLEISINTGESWYETK